jgi:DNA polymerase-3 subunit delta
MNNLFLFHGEDQKSVQNEVKNWQTKFLAKYPDSANLSILREVNLPELMIEINTPPFLGDKRLVIAYNIYAKHNKTPEYDRLLKTLETFAETTILLLIEENTLAKNATIIRQVTKFGQVKNFEKSKSNLKKEITLELKRNNKTINPILAEELIHNLNQDHFKVLNEIRKLGLYAPKDEITQQDIKDLVRFDANISVFKLMDDLSSKQIKRCIDTLNDLSESGEDLMMILHLVMRQIRLLLSIKYLKAQSLNVSDISKKAKLQPFIVKKLMMQVENFSSQRLKALITNLLEIDANIKRGKLKYSKKNKIELLFELEKFLIKAVA